ncbi:phosphoribosylaminoimidazole carboxylase ATPase subunit [Thiohalobacter thiocyanaticus]|uniref:N5-carboxyaminoimidazole ribonucleotide synthase n=1 Tax=Thiohalobacter thiocyanaticus TaxID=585455 RepID=A0A1Z4VMT3_9GAMM|nr:5-(carboxyamino)imidazole ribonucleotide synthase [Thiohalobacter thiocyanaticus]BAZ92907.1 phosphoribosylaminoimidazole carboxylase ATPase subunit [Thiohalobacter thiocyanaticus]
MILPGATLGVLGGGQLGRMFVMAAHAMGYRVIVLDPDPHSPAGLIAEQHLRADYQDHAALQVLGDTCSAVTTEFENVPAASLDYLARLCPVRPAPAAVAIAQDRIREKRYIQEQGLATAPFAVIEEPEDLDEAFARLDPPLLLKTASLGYDGKGQAPVDSLEQARAAFAELGGQPCVLEARVELERELSVILARSLKGETAVYPVGENHHVDGILDTTIVPARMPAVVTDQAVDMARTLAESMDYVGVMAVEFFHTRQGELLINELAPRPHNSGHYTLDATITSQFEQQVRCLCGLPPGDTLLLSPVVMVNLLGDLWQPEPPWEKLFAYPAAKLHLYGKRVARPGRKMGHFNCLAPELDNALAQVERIREALSVKR